MKLEFLQEIAMMKRVSTGKNPYVVNMIGCCSVQEPLALVLELVPNGNLLEYLKANRTIVSSELFCGVQNNAAYICVSRLMVFVLEQEHMFMHSFADVAVI